MADDDKESDYVRELNIQHERFLALGGGKDLQMEMKGWTPLKDLVTDQHRKIVFDLAASGLSNEDVAIVMGISKERLQVLFEREIATAFQLCQASLSRSLYYQGIAGNEKASTNWLALHNRSKWAKKQQLSGDPDGAPIKTEEVGSAREVLNKLLSGLATSKSMTGKSKEIKPAPAKATVAAPKKKAGKAKPIRHVKKEQDIEQTKVVTRGASRASQDLTRSSRWRRHRRRKVLTRASSML
jgi:hypothetical protein